MLIFVIILSVIVAISFLVTLVFFIIFIAHTIKKDSTQRSRKLKAFVISAIIWILIVSLDVTLLLVNRNEIFDTAIKSTAELAANGLGTTAANLGKYYDESVIKRFEGLEISVSKSDVEVKKDRKVYKIDLVFNNQNSLNEKIYLHILIENNYLVACDADDFVYDVTPIIDSDFEQEGEYNEYEEYDKIPVGKTKHSIRVAVSKETNIKYLRFLDRELKLEK